jgi:uncharacterized protein involved in cysteine biosynthesis
MSVLAVGTTVTVLALIGLVIGLVVLLVVIYLLNGVLAPLRAVLRDVRNAQTAPVLERGVQGVDQLDRSQRLAQSVPDLAVAYMQKLGLAVDTNPRGATFPDPAPPDRHGQGRWR